MSELIEAIFARARYKGVPMARLADKAGLRPETLSRLKSRENFDWRTLNSLALAVGCRLELVPLDAAAGDAVYSPRDNAIAKVESRQHDEALIASGQASPEEIQHRTAFSLPRAKFPLKGLDRDE